MEQQSQQSQKKFQVIEEWHRQRPNQKIYKLRLYLTGNMIKAEQKLLKKYQLQIAQINQPQVISVPIPSGTLSSNQMQDQIANHILRQQVRELRTPRPQPAIKIYENFKNWGKHDNLKFFYSKEKQRITIIVLQKYFLHELKCKQFDLLLIYQSFTKVWQQEYIQIMQAFMKYEKEFRNHEIIRFEFVAIDIIGVTFDIYYNSKTNEKVGEHKRFRFRYSPFQFRQNPFFDQKSTEQIMSYIDITSNNMHTLTHRDFYTSMRLGFIDDINNNSNDLWRRMIMRFWVFYQLHCLNRGMNEFEDFNKKALGRVYFHPIRMKKFQLIFPFTLLNKSVIEEKRQATIYITFYIEDKDISVSEHGLQFKMTVNLVEYSDILTYDQKRQIIDRLKKEDSFTIIEKEILPKPNELFEFYMTLKFDDRIAKAFARFQTIISYFIDKIAFNQTRSSAKYTPEQQDGQKIVEIYSKPFKYEQKLSQYLHTHQLCLQLKFKPYVPVVFQNPPITKFIDEIYFHKLTKKKTSTNIREKKEVSTDRCQLILHDDLKRYITQTLRMKPLRECHKEIIQYVESVIRVVYSPYREHNFLTKYNNRQVCLNLVVSNIIKLLQTGNNHLRKSQILILTENDPLFIRNEEQKDLLAEVTFCIKDLKIYWIKRLPQGYIMIRMFEERIQVVKDFGSTVFFKVDYENIEKTSTDFLAELKNTLIKEFASLQTMMI